MSGPGEERVKAAWRLAGRLRWTKHGRNGGEADIAIPPQSVTALLLTALAAAVLPTELGPAWAEFTSDPQLTSIDTRIEIGARGYDSDRRQLDFWLRRTVTVDGVSTVTWTDSRRCPVVWEVLVGMRDLPVPRFAPAGVSEGPPLYVDGTLYTLRTYSNEGEIAVEANEGTPLAGWVESSLNVLENCWETTIPQRTS